MQERYSTTSFRRGASPVDTRTPGPRDVLTTVSDVTTCQLARRVLFQLVCQVAVQRLIAILTGTDPPARSGGGILATRSLCATRLSRDRVRSTLRASGYSVESLFANPRAARLTLTTELDTRQRRVIRRCSGCSSARRQLLRHRRAYGPQTLSDRGCDPWLNYYALPTACGQLDNCVRQAFSPEAW